jgi:putative ABC transport system permease protein
MAAPRKKVNALRTVGLTNIKFALNAMRTQKLRSCLTLLGITAGVATVIAMVSFVVGFNNAVTGAFTELGATRVRFQKYEPGTAEGDDSEAQRRRRDLTLEDADTLKRFATLAMAVSPERTLTGNSDLTSSVKNQKGTEANAPTVVGVTPDYSPANNHYVADGRFFSESDIAHGVRLCVIGPDVAQALWPDQDPIGQELLLNGIPLQVAGLLEKKGAFLGGSNDNKLLLPISTFDELFPEIRDRSRNALHIATLPKTPEQVQALMDQEVALLRTRRSLRPDQDNDFAVVTSDGDLESFQQITFGVAAVMVLIASISLLVGGVGVMNIMLVTVTERTREIGIRKALGATNRDIAAQFLVESLSLTGVGGVIGIVLGMGTALLAGLLFDFPVATPIWSVLLGFGVSSAVGIFFGLWPAMKAAKQDPIEALRYE